MYISLTRFRIPPFLINTENMCDINDKHFEIGTSLDKSKLYNYV